MPRAGGTDLLETRPLRRYEPRPISDEAAAAAYLDLVDRRASGRPYVVVNMVASADGAIAVDGRTKALSSEADRFVFHHLRSLSDVILVGAQTVRAERYGPPVVSEERQAARVARGQAPVPRIAVVSRSLDLDWGGRLFTDSPTRPFVLAPEDADPDRLAEARAVADVVMAGEGSVDLAAALAGLHGAGVDTVLCEGGPTLNGQLAAVDLIDELCLTLAPTLVGGDVAAGILGHLRLPGLLAMTTVHVLEGDGDLFLRYRRARTGEPGPTADAVNPEAAIPAVGDRVEAFESLVGDLDYPMLVVTAAADGERSGCLVGFAAQCSIDPPRFMVWLSKRNHTLRVAARADALAVHVLAADQHDLADRFGSQSGDDVDKFEGLDWRPGTHGAPVLGEVSRWFVGLVTETLDSGDHVAFMLAPVAGDAGPWAGQLGFQSVRDVEPGHPA